jgi:ankyrin repeat protein
MPSIDFRDKQGRTGLLWACYAGHLKSAQILLDHGADINLGDIYSRTPLMWAATSSLGLPIVELLLERGANVHLQDSSGATALNWALEGGKKDVVSIIAQHLYGVAEAELLN